MRHGVGDKVKSLEGIERVALVAIQSGCFSVGGLARVLRVSEVTAARVVAALRTKGFPIISVRDNRGWRYELRSEGMFRERWQSSSLREMAGAAKGRGRRALVGKREDQVIYETD